MKIDLDGIQNRIIALPTDPAVIRSFCRRQRVFSITPQSPPKDLMARCPAKRQRFTPTI